MQGLASPLPSLVTFCCNPTTLSFKVFTAEGHYTVLQVKCSPQGLHRSPSGSVVKECTCQCRRCRRPWFNPWGEEMATCSTILAWKIPWIEEPGRVEKSRTQPSDWALTNKVYTELAPLSSKATFCTFPYFLEKDPFYKVHRRKLKGIWSHSYGTWLKLLLYVFILHNHIGENNCILKKINIKLV